MKSPLPNEIDELSESWGAVILIPLIWLSVLLINGAMYAIAIPFMIIWWPIGQLFKLMGSDEWLEDLQEHNKSAEAKRNVRQPKRKTK